MALKAILATGLGLLALATGTVTQAAPITYTGVLFDSVTALGDIPTTGSFTSASDTFSDYWSFSGTSGDLFSLIGLRLEGAFDMAFWVFEGIYADDSAFGVSLDSSDLGFLAFGDDQIPHPGPFGDPFVSFALPSTGQYTVIVTNFFSGADDGDGLFPYQLTATGVSAIPLPAAFPLLLVGIGAIGLVGRRSRRKS